MSNPKAMRPTRPLSEVQRYWRTGLFSVAVFAAFYGYTSYLGIPGTLNKAVADTAIFLIGLSMVLSSVCYFWNFLDDKIAYRKHLGLVGFAFGIAHLLLSWSAFLSLFQATNWMQGRIWPAFTGLLALAIFAVMAVASFSSVARVLGRWWRPILRTGYLAMIFVWLHVVLLKSGRWWTWYEGGMKTLPALSLLVTIFMIWVFAMRLLLWWSLRCHRPVTVTPKAKLKKRK